MSLLQINTVLLICIYVTNVFGFYSLQNGYRVLLKDRNIRALRMQDESRYIDQPLDHFNDKDNRTWSMRYFEALELWKNGGPVYLFIGGEAEANAYYIRNGFIYELANETNGALYMSEHRYYGKSKPFSELNIKNLAYLSSRQALADVAKLLRQIKSLPQYNGSKVVVVGGSYPGNLAEWMRLLYPDLVDAAIATSAPVLAKADFYEYLETVGKVYRQYGSPECYDKIAKKFNRYDQLFQTSAGIEQLKDEEEICESVDLSRPENKQVFFMMKGISYMLHVQYGDPSLIKKKCDFLYDNSKNLMLFEQGLWNEEDSCSEYTFDCFIASIKINEDYMTWTYQTCTEFGYFMTTNSENQPFTRNQPIELFYRMCSVLYGPEFNKTRVDEAVKKTNDMYGGLKPNVTKVAFVNGDMDPWHRLGVLQDLSEDAPALLVPGTSHCAFLGTNSSEDPDEMREARTHVKLLIKKWIGVGYSI